ncbi:MAG: ABC transporter ATP-binding protein [Victivallaceae bacterium]|nr:ABC transporter ATP-binding protein [Victivallaceae bacterium]
MRKQNWSLLKAYKGRIGSIVIGNVAANFPRGAFNGLLYLIVLSLAVPVLEKSGHDFGLLWKYYWFYTAAFGLYIVLGILGQCNNFVQSYTIGPDVRLKLGEKLRRLSLGFFKNNDPGDVTSRMLHDVNKAEEVFSHSLPDLVSALVVPILLGIFLCFINLKLAMVLFAVTALAMIFFVIARKVIEKLGKKHLKAINAASSRILEYANTIKTLKAYNMTGSGFKELDKSMLYLKKMSFRAEVWTGIPVQIALMILDIGYLVMIFSAVKMCLAASLSIPELFSFVILGFYFFEPVKKLGINLVLLRHAANSMDRIDEIFNTGEPRFKEKRVLSRKHDFKFEKVTFRYHRHDILKDIDCYIPEKSMTALVGVSGSGKTTMTNLMARFWDVQSGRILYGGTDIREIEPEKLLTDISMVFQDVFLFNDTIANNIRIGNIHAGDDELVKAAKLANCHDFIMDLPDGYNTLVSEGGKTLSGGERQRISIARAILKDAPVILLDEATASLDPENENDIQNAIDHLVKNKTLIVIAHKFSTIEKAEQVLVLDNGAICESGTHTSLIKSNGLYSKLWQAQQKAGSWKMQG